MGSPATAVINLADNDPTITFTARWVVRRVAGKKWRMVRVEEPDGSLIREFVSPFQKPKFKAFKVVVLDGNGDGADDSVLLSARNIKKRKKVTRTFVV